MAYDMHRCAGQHVITISITGKSGYILLMLCLAAIFYMVGYSTNNWYIDGVRHEGIWQTCSCTTHSSDWLDTVQSLLSIGFAGLAVAVTLIFVYAFTENPCVNKTAVIICLSVTCIITIFFMALGFIVYGANRESPNWSFAIAVLGGIFTSVAAILTCVETRRAGIGRCS